MHDLFSEIESDKEGANLLTDESLKKGEEEEMLNFRPPSNPPTPPIPPLLRRPPPWQVIYTGNDNTEAHIALPKTNK